MFLKTFRQVSAILFFVVLTFFFVDFTGVMPLRWHALAQLQILPLLLGGMVGGLVFWGVLTLLTGRVYCSVVCPLGVSQDIFSRIARWIVLRWRYKYNSITLRHRVLRYGFFLALLVGLIVPVPIFVTLLDPYSTFGQIVSHWLYPLVLFGNNLVAAIAHAAGNYSVYFRPIHLSGTAMLVSAVFFALIAYLSGRYGRWYCNSVCPVGTLLGLLSRFSLVRIRLNERCVGCMRCEAVCKGECIDIKHRKIDASRCVLCFNCIPACRKEAIFYSIKSLGPQASCLREAGERLSDPMQTGSPRTQGQAGSLRSQASVASRRQWILVAAGLAIAHWVLRFTPLAYLFSGAARVSAAVPENLPSGTSRVSYELTHPIFPPGGKEIKTFQRRCTGCHLCVSKCPAGILTPATTEYGINGFLQPVVKFRHGFCNYDCTICTRVCPTHALQPLHSPEEKHQVQIGKVHFLQENCVVNTQGSNCGACGEHCPTGAVKMVPFGPSELYLTIPEVRPELCVGCGACEHICPVTPYKAIYIDGLSVHQKAEPAYDPNAEQEVLHTDDFGF